MALRTLLAASILILGACGAEPDVAAPPPVASAPVPLDGLYQVRGTTVEVESGRERDIQGTLILKRDGDRYRSTFNLRTRYPAEGGYHHADVIGSGEGSIDGNRLEGTAETQLVLSKVAGIDASFPFVPRQVGPRIVSTSVGEHAEDGTFTIEISSQAKAGEVYAATHTTLRGTRVGPVDAWRERD